ncbi:hypothetical protein [Adhaeribacter rhizoryzae]|nr:hypothetical protein [Adhaeribacter rhizoryzae]
MKIFILPVILFTGLRNKLSLNKKAGAVGTAAPAFDKLLYS